MAGALLTMRSRRVVDFETMMNNPEARGHMAAAASFAEFDPILCEVTTPAVRFFGNLLVPGDRPAAVAAQGHRLALFVPLHIYDAKCSQQHPAAAV